MIKYWVAGHVTGIFEIFDDYQDPLYNGSRGAGFSISRGVKTAVEYSTDGRNHIFFNNQEVDLKQANVSRNVLEQYQSIVSSKNKISGINITHTFEIPLSAGFGASAAGALGLSFALSDLYELNFDRIRKFQIAHTAEVIEGGGLGDIIALHQGGWEMRTKPGAPSIGKTSSMIANKNYTIGTLSFGPLQTKEIIRNPRKKEIINKEGKKLMDKLEQTPTISTFTQCVKRFTFSINLYSNKIKTIIERYDRDRLFIGQIMLGDGIFVIAENTDLLHVIDGIRKEKICSKTVKRLM